MISRRGVLCLEQEVGVSDAAFLETITEDSLVANLHQRFKRDQIYVSQRYTR